jgi:two-component system copper resistance phosphate regulon response regulator CusR
MRLLIVEDDAKVAAALKKGLKEEGYAIDSCADGDEALILARTYEYDLILLDLMLPGKDGWTVCRELRANKIIIPILMLTARDALEDKVKGLRAGADDYLTKPFAFEELLARIQALFRRTQEYKTKTLKILDLELDPYTKKATRSGRPISLTAKEYALLEFLMRNAGRVVTPSMILEHVWDINMNTASNVVNVYINHLREKIETDTGPKLIRTIRGMGYELRKDDDVSA